MRLREENWIVAGGPTAEWAAVTAARRRTALSGIREAAALLRRAGPAAERRALAAGCDFFLRVDAPARDRLLTHPALDHWLSLGREHFAAPRPARDWRLHFGLFQGFAAALALETRRPLEVALAFDADGHGHLYGSPWVLDGGRAAALRTRRVRLDPGGVRAGAWRTLRRAQAAPGVLVEPCGLLIARAVVMHGLAAPSPAREAAFARVIGRALAEIADKDPALGAEIGETLRAVVPLDNPKGYGSVSSSYVNLRGAVCLSHSDDALLQAETLIHEFCHQKMNLLLLVEPVLLPGQDGQAFYSPWRPDARRLRGLLLGAHAFLNVARYLARSLSRDEHPPRRRTELMGMVARRTTQTEAALRTLCDYGRFTEFGRRFVLGMCRENRALSHAALRYPDGAVRRARKDAARHRRRHALPGTGIHRGDER